MNGNPTRATGVAIDLIGTRARWTRDIVRVGGASAAVFRRIAQLELERSTSREEATPSRRVVFRPQRRTVPRDPEFGNHSDEQRVKMANPTSANARLCRIAPGELGQKMP
jgi:hypothetical protein